MFYECMNVLGNLAIITLTITVAEIMLKRILTLNVNIAFDQMLNCQL